MAIPSHKVCPDCGATLAACETCWLCLQRVAAARAVAEHEPTAGQAATPLRPFSDWGILAKLTMAFIVAVMTIPAGIAALVVTCLWGPQSPPPISLPTGPTVLLSGFNCVATVAILATLLVLFIGHLSRPTR